MSFNEIRIACTLEASQFHEFGRTEVQKSEQGNEVDNVILVMSGTRMLKYSMAFCIDVRVFIEVWQEEDKERTESIVSCSSLM